jgi:outer membrane biosynthesis protein TonB
MCPSLFDKPKIPKPKPVKEAPPPPPRPASVIEAAEAAAPTVEVPEIGSRREKQDRELGRDGRSETRRADRATANIYGDGSGLRL